jgi:hypothetical protein
MEKRENDLFQFFPINIHATPQHSAITGAASWGALNFDTPVLRRCPAIAGNDDSCDSHLPTPGGGLHEKKNESEKIEPAEDQAWSP